MTMRAGTASGLYEFDRAGERTGLLLEGRSIDAVSGDWVVTGDEVVSLSSGAHGRADGLKPHCLVEEGTGLYVGTERARLFVGDRDACQLTPVGSFDQIETRDQWHTPWGGPPDTRSLTATNEGAVLVNVHVGGVWRSDDVATWHEVIEVDADTHQVLADPETTTVIAAAAVGFGQSDDGGVTWRWTDEGLHGPYCRAAAVAGDTVLVSASTGPRTRQGAVYRRPVRSNSPFERCEVKRAGEHGWFPYNVTTFQLVAQGESVVLGTEEGSIFVSDDAGASWTPLVEGLPAIRCVAIAAA